jgi:hypothetical protein
MGVGGKKMINGDFLDKFYDWLKEGNASWEELGLKDDAPDEAKTAYTEYVEMMKQAREEGVDY